MFQLVKNDFIKNGICHYSDDYGNKVVIRRTGDISFVAKLRFAENGITASPMYIDVQKIVNEGVPGETLHLDYSSDAKIDSESVNSAINSFSELVQYWISLFSDLRFAWCDNSVLLKQLKTDKEQCSDSWCGGVVGNVEDATEIDIYTYKCNLLLKYKELEPILSTLIKPEA